jgi:hypothetical protein
MHTQKSAMTTPSVAARLAGVDHFEIAHAGKPDCYGDIRLASDVRSNAEHL